MDLSHICSLATFPMQKQIQHLVSADMVSGLFCTVKSRWNSICHATVNDCPWKSLILYHSPWKVNSMQRLYEMYMVAYSHLRSSRIQLCEELLYSQWSCGVVSKGQHRNGIVPSFLLSESTCQCLFGSKYDRKGERI